VTPVWNEHTFAYRVELLRKEHAGLKREAKRAELLRDMTEKNLFLQAEGPIEQRKAIARTGPEYEAAYHAWIDADHQCDLKLAEIKGTETGFEEWKEKRWADRAGSKIL